MNVVHIKDSVCTLPTSILAQYLKQANGQLSCLKVKQTSFRSPLSSQQEKMINRAIRFPAIVPGNGQLDELRRGRRVLGFGLGSSPRRAVQQQRWRDEGCAGRFRHRRSGGIALEHRRGTALRRLPVLSSLPSLAPLQAHLHLRLLLRKAGSVSHVQKPIKSYFCIRGEEYMPLETEINPCKQRQSNHGPTHWLHDWNDRLTDFLGFAR